MQNLTRDIFVSTYQYYLLISSYGVQKVLGMLLSSNTLPLLELRKLFNLAM